MSGPHQPGWDDEELISLHDLHVSRKSLGVPEHTESHLPHLHLPKPALNKAPARSAQSTKPAVKQAARKEASQARRPEGDQARKPHAQKGAARPEQHHMNQPVETREQRRPQEQRPREHRHEDARPQHPAPRKPALREPETVRLEDKLRKMLPAMPGKSATAVNDKLREQMRFPLRDAKVGVFSRKGGVGKTTITAYLGLTLVSMRNRPIVAVDGDSESGSLGWLLAPNGNSTLDELVAANPMPESRKDFSQYVTHTQSGLDVVLGDTSEVPTLDDSGLHSAIDNLAKSYDMSLYDTGSGVTHSAGRALINGARVLLLVMNTSVDSVRAAERTLAWLDEREDASDEPTTVIAVVNGIPSSMRLSQIQQIEQLFADRCAAVVRIPFDEHLAAGTTQADLAALSKPTQLAFQQLALTTVKVLARSMPLQMNRAQAHA